MKKLLSLFLITLSFVSSLAFTRLINPTIKVHLLYSLIVTYPLYLLFSKSVQAHLAAYKNTRKYSFILINILIALMLFIGFFKRNDVFNNFILKERISIYLSIILILYSLVSLSQQSLLKFNIIVNKRIINKIHIIFYSLPIILIWIFFLIAYYPGVMSVDSLNQWEQIMKGIFWDGHPVIHTLFLKFLIKLWPSPASIAIAQIFITSIIIGFGLYSIETFGIKKKYLFITAIFFAVFPTFGFMSIILWKDILFSAFLMLFSLLTVNIVLTNGEYLVPKENKILIIISSSIICLFRHNGLLSFLGTIILLFMFFKKYWKSNLIIFISTILIFILVKGPLYRVLNVSPTTSNEALAIPTQQIAMVIKNDGYLTDDQRAYLNNILPLDLWKENYNLRTVDPIKMHKNFNREFITKDMNTFLKTWFQIVKQNPRLAIRAYTYQTEIIWMYNGPAYLANMEIPDNQLGLENKVISSNLTDFFSQLYEKITTFKYKRIFWSPALFMYLSIFFVIISILRNKISALIVIVPMSLNIFTYLLAIPAPDFRYLYSNLLITPFIILFSFIKYSDNSSNYIIK